MKRYYLYRIARQVVKLFMHTVYRIKVINSNFIPESGRCILAGNHTNNLDPLLLMSSTKRTIRFMAKKEIHIGILKPLFLSAGTIPVDRSKKDETVKTNALEALKNEELLGIFPEGTINRTDDTIMPFKYGTVSFANTTDSPIVPFVITGKYKIFRKSITVEFLTPYKLETNDLTKENEKLMNIIKSKLEENE